MGYITRKKKAKELSIDFVPHIYQSEFFSGWRQFNELICCRRFGKSVLAVIALVQTALELSGRKKPPKFAYIAPLKDQAKQIVWPIFKEFLDPLIKSGMVRIKDAEMEVHFTHNNAVIKLYGTDKNGAEPIRGQYLDGVVLDEYDDISPHVYKEIVLPCLADTMGWVLFCGTIKGRSNLHKLWKKNRDNNRWNVKVYNFESCRDKLPAYCDAIEVFPKDDDGNPDYKAKPLIEYIPSPAKVQMFLDEYSDDPEAYKREMMCDFDADVKDKVCPNSLINLQRGIFLRNDQYVNAPKIMGVDVAFAETGDRASIVKRQGLNCQEPLWWRGVDNMAFADIIANHINSWQPDAVFIDKGRGEGVISRLRQLGYTVIGVDFGGRTLKPDIFQNKRMEMWWAIRKWLEQGGALPNDEDLCSDLFLPSYMDEYGKMKLESKKEMKKKHGKSPDLGDALALTFAMPVIRRHNEKHNFNKNVKNTITEGYNPISARR